MPRTGYSCSRRCSRRGVAVNTKDAFASAAGARACAISYVVIRLILLLLYARAYAQEPRARPLCGRYLAGFSVGAALWTASVFVASPGRYAL